MGRKQTQGESTKQGPSVVKAERVILRTNDLLAGWRSLSLEVGRRLGRPVGAGRVRYRVESSGLPIGRRVGASLIFDSSDVDAAVRLFGSAR